MKSEKEEFNNEMVYPLITSEQNDIENNPNDTSGGTSEKLLKTFTGYDKSMKIILLGDSGVGKTSLLNIYYFLTLSFFQASSRLVLLQLKRLLLVAQSSL